MLVVATTSRVEHLFYNDEGSTKRHRRLGLSLASPRGEGKLMLSLKSRLHQLAEQAGCVLNQDQAATMIGPSRSRLNCPTCSSNRENSSLNGARGLGPAVSHTG